MRYPLLFLCTVLLADCSASGSATQSPSTSFNSLSHASLLPASTRHAEKKSGTLTTLYRFGAYPDGENPDGLIEVNGTFYGVTSAGGSGRGPCAHDGSGCGTVFSLTPEGTEKVLYSFQGGKDGASPTGALIYLDGALYGTTSFGGGCPVFKKFGCGTVFSVSLSGAETVLYRFQGYPDGMTPAGGLIAVNGVLYGTTGSGGNIIDGKQPADLGTVFSITPSGKYQSLYSFKGGTVDGDHPDGSLTAVDGVLYGTLNGDNLSSGAGSVYRITTSGAETVLYKFQAGDDGWRPIDGLTYAAGLLYGVTLQGGGACSSQDGCGTVYSITPAGSETVLHRFAGPDEDGAQPRGAVTSAGGASFGTTASGGSNGYGAIFVVSKSGAERLLYSFTGGADGGGPSGGLVRAADGTLNGTTASLGKSDYGTVYSFKP